MKVSGDNTLMASWWAALLAACVLLSGCSAAVRHRVHHARPSVRPHHSASGARVCVPGEKRRELIVMLDAGVPKLDVALLWARMLASPDLEHVSYRSVAENTKLVARTLGHRPTYQSAATLGALVRTTGSPGRSLREFGSAPGESESGPISATVVCGPNGQFKHRLFYAWTTDVYVNGRKVWTTFGRTWTRPTPQRPAERVASGAGFTSLLHAETHKGQLQADGSGQDSALAHRARW
jgi:hypothetical protein